MDRKTRDELNELSKRVFGSSSKWQKLVDKGVSEPYERDREVMVPTAGGRFAKKVFTDRKYMTKRYTVEEVRKLMQDILDKNSASGAVLDAIVPSTTAGLATGDSVVGAGIPANTVVTST